MTYIKRLSEIVNEAGEYLLTLKEGESIELRPLPDWDNEDDDYNPDEVSDKLMECPLQLYVDKNGCPSSWYYLHKLYKENGNIYAVGVGADDNSDIEEFGLNNDDQYVIDRDHITTLAYMMCQVEFNKETIVQ